MNTKENWIDKTMESLDGAGRLVLNHEVQEKIIKEILLHQRGKEMSVFPMVWKFAAVIVILIGLNVFTFTHSTRSTVQNPERTIATEYFSYLDTYNF